MNKDDPTLRIASVVAVVAAAVVLVWATGRHPYSYYQVLRWVTTCAAGLLVWRGAVQGFKWAWALVPLAILFNPIAPIRLSRDTWGILDVASAVILVAALVAMELLGVLKRRQGGPRS